MLKIIPESLLHSAPAAAGADLEIRFLGTAGFVLTGDNRTIVLDPFISRPSLSDTLRRPLVPNEDAIARHIPAADDVLIGHAHHDHVMDAPSLCHQTGARFIGGPDACNVARAAGLSERQIRETKGRETIESGAGSIRGLPSRHGKVYLGRVAFAGNIPTPPRWPPRFYELKHGLVLNWLVELAGVRVMHIDSADFIPEELEGIEVDVLCMCAIGRHHRPNFTEEAISLLRPKYVIPCHWDWFFDPFTAPSRLLPGVDLPGYIQEIEQAGATAIVLPTGGIFGVDKS